MEAVAGLSRRGSGVKHGECCYDTNDLLKCTLLNSLWCLPISIQHGRSLLSLDVVVNTPVPIDATYIHKRGALGSVPAEPRSESACMET